MAAVGGGSGGHSCLPCVWCVAVSATHAAWVFSIGPWILIGWKLLPEPGNWSGNCWSAFLVGNLNLNGGRPKVYTPSYTKYTKSMFCNPSCWNHTIRHTMVVIFLWQGSLFEDTNPKQCTTTRESFKNDHTFQHQVSSPKNRWHFISPWSCKLQTQVIFR